MEVIPLDVVPSQIVGVSLGTQLVELSVYQKSTGLYMDVAVSGVPVITGVVCENLNRIVRDAYLGFVGDLTFFDNMGATDPVYTGFGTRYSLLYISPADPNIV